MNCSDLSPFPFEETDSSGVHHKILYINWGNDLLVPKLQELLRTQLEIEDDHKIRVFWATPSVSPNARHYVRVDVDVEGCPGGVPTKYTAIATEVKDAVVEKIVEGKHSLFSLKQ